MTDRTIELFKQAGSEAYKLCKERGHNVGAIDNIWVSIMASNLAELIVEESCRLMQERWYELNDEPVAEGETLRDVGIRIGKKSELVRMKQVIALHFGIK